MAKFGGISGEHLRQYVQRIEQLEEEKKDLAENIRDVYAEAKGNGFDTKVMRQIIKIRKMEEQEREELETILDIYLHALGMLPEGEYEEEEYDGEAGADDEYEEEDGGDEEIAA